jgi:hypothetical protein
MLIQRNTHLKIVSLQRKFKLNYPVFSAIILIRFQEITLARKSNMYSLHKFRACLL